MLPKFAIARNFGIGFVSGFSVSSLMIHFPKNPLFPEFPVLSEEEKNRKATSPTGTINF
jgi:hypothetical protein